MTLSDPVSGLAIDGEFDAISALLGYSGGVDSEIPLFVATLVQSTDERDRSVAWTQQEDAELRIGFARGTASGAALSLTWRLEVEDDVDGFYLAGETIDGTATSAGAGTVDTRTNGDGDYRDDDGVRIRLIRGLRYRLSVETSASGGASYTNVTACVQFRTKRRGVGLPPSAPVAPWLFGLADAVDLDWLNDSFEWAQRSITRVQDQRYTYGVQVWDFDGVADTADADLRRVHLRRRAASRGLEIIGYELVVYGTAGATWTATCSDSSSPPISVATAGATTEAFVTTGRGFSVPSESADVTITLSASAASTPARMYVVVHTRCDRWNQGTAKTEYTATPLTSDTPTAVATLNAEFTAAAAALSASSSAGDDVRALVFTARGLTAGQSRAFRIPSGQYAGASCRGYAVADVGATATCTVGATGSAAMAGAGATTLVTTNDAAFTDVPNDDPMDSTDDLVVTIAITGAGTCQMAQFVIWFV